MDKRKKALLIGLVLGDGHLNKSNAAALEISHCGKQKSYLEYKAKLIEELLNCKPLTIHKRKGREEYKISKGHRYFRVIYNWIYKDGKKVFSKKLLNYLTPEAVALWFMDDGTHGIDRNKKTGAITAHKFVLYTFTNKEDTENIIEFFQEKFGVKFYPLKRIAKDGSEQFYLQCRTKQGEILCNQLRKYIIPEMQYKML